MEGLATFYKTIAFIGDSRVKNLYPSHEWLGTPPRLIYDSCDKAKIDFIIKRVEEKLNEISKTDLLVVVLGLHSDLVDLIPSTKQKHSHYAKQVLEGIIQKITLAADKWKNLNESAKFMWCIPCIPDFKRLANKSSYEQSIPYDEQDDLATHQVRSYLDLVKELKSLWENCVPSDFVLVDLNLVFNDHSFYQVLEDSMKLPDFDINQTTDGLHLSPSMSPIFWRYILSISEPEIVEEQKDETYLKKPSIVRKSPRLNKRKSRATVLSKEEVFEPIIDVFPLAEDDIDSESWLKEELGVEGADILEETHAPSVLENELLKVFNLNHTKVSKTKELWKKIPGLSYIIGIKPDSVSTFSKCKYDCVMCSSHVDCNTLTDEELKAHIQSKQHVLNVMMLENISLYERYVNDEKTSTQTMFNKILEYEAHLGPQNIISATEKTYVDERARVITQLMDDLTAQDDLKNSNQKEKGATLEHYPLHVNSVVRKYKKITTKNKENKILSIVKKLVNKKGDELMDITAIEKRAINPIKLSFAAKGPGIVSVNGIEKSATNPIKQSISANNLGIVSDKVLNIKKDGKVDQKSVNRKEVVDKDELSSPMDLEYPMIPIRKYTIHELDNIHKHYCIPVLALKNRQKNRIQDNIVIVTDERENFDIHLANFNEKVTVFKVPELGFYNAFEIVKTHPNFGKGTLFIFSCGNHDLLKKELWSECVKANCPTPQSIFALTTTELDFSFFIKKAIGLHLQILESTPNDNVLFCGIHTAVLNATNLNLIENRPCLDYHTAEPYEKIKNQILRRQRIAFDSYHQFVIYHAQILGYKGWNLPVSFSKTERDPVKYPIYTKEAGFSSYCPAVHERNGNMAKSLCLEILQKMSSKTTDDSLMEVSPYNESECKVPFEQVAIITNSQYLPYLGKITTLNEVKIIAIKDMNISELNIDYIKNNENMSKRTLYLIVVGVHDGTKTDPAEKCLALGCEPCLLSLSPLTKNYKRLPLVKKLKLDIEEIKVSLPEGSDIAILPPLPATLLPNGPVHNHKLLHDTQNKHPLCKFATSAGSVVSYYSKFMNDIYDLAFISLLKITNRLERNLESTRNCPNCFQVNFEKSLTYKLAKANNNFWQQKVKTIILKVLAFGNEHYEDKVLKSDTNSYHNVKPTINHPFGPANNWNEENVLENENWNNFSIHNRQQDGNYSYQYRDSFVSSSIPDFRMMPPQQYNQPLPPYNQPLQTSISTPDFRMPPPQYNQPLPPYNQPLQTSSRFDPQMIGQTSSISSFDTCSADFSYGGHNVINRDFDEIIQFAKIIQNSSKISTLPGGISHMFANVYIVGAKSVINPLLECNIKTTIINHNFSDFEENDFHQVLNKIGSPQQKSVCCLVFNISTVLATRLEMSSGCLTYSCKPPLYLSTLQSESLSIPGVMDKIGLFTTNQLQRISKFVKRLSNILPVVILPLNPTRIYCEDLVSHNHQTAHSINSLGYPVVFGSQALWQKTIQSLILSWNTLMEVTNRNYDSCNYTSSYIASHPKTFLVLDNIDSFIASWLEPDIWKGFAEAFLMSLVPKKVNINRNDRRYSSDMVQVSVSQISPSIPPNFFEELFYTVDSNVIIIKEKEKYVLKGMSIGTANLLVKKLNNYHVGDTVLTAATAIGNDDANELSLMQRLIILTGIEKVHRKYKPEIIQNLLKRINEVPDVASLKTSPCMEDQTCRGPNLCYYYHGPLDKRRNPYLYTYMDALCSKSQMADGFCQDGVMCDFCHNVYELKFHPIKYQVRLCPSGKPAETCRKQDLLCNYAHKDSPEMFYVSGWEDLILFGPHHALDYFTGAIRSASKIKDIKHSSFKVILVSPSIEFLDVAVKTSGILLKKFGLNIGSLDKNDYDMASSQVLTGNPSSFCNLSGDFFKGMKGAIIVEDIQNILKNEKLKELMGQSFKMIKRSPNVVLNKVFVSATYEYELPKTISEVMGLQLKPLWDYDHGMKTNQSFGIDHNPLSESLSQRLGKQQSLKESTVVRYPTTSHYPKKRASSRSPSPASTKRKHHHAAYSRPNRSRSPSPASTKRKDHKAAYPRPNRSRSPSPASTKRKDHQAANSGPNKSRPPSPIFSKSHLELSKRLGKKRFEEYSLALEKMYQDFEGEFSVYNSMPELYPGYENFYSSFVEMYNMQHKGKSAEHRERLWKLFWKAKVEEIKKNDWGIKQNNLLKEFDKGGLTSSVSSSNHGSVSSSNHGSYSFEGTIDLIDGLCNDLGFLGPSVKSMLKSSRDMGTSSKDAYKMFTDSENIMLINMVLDKIKSLYQSASGEKLHLYKKVTDWIPKFLEDAKNGPPTPKNKDLIDVDAIGRASVGKGSKFALDLIKTAMAYEGISNPSKELINDLFLKVCNVHYTLSMDE